LSNMNFGYPVTLSVIHMLCCVIGTNLFLYFTQTKESFKNYDWNFRLSKVLPLAILFVSNMILGNASLKWVTVSLMQTIKTTVPLFTVAIQVLLMSKRFPYLVYVSLIPTVVGVMLASWTEPAFDIRGFWAAVFSSMVSACISVVSGVLLSVKLDSIYLLYLMAPLCLSMLLPASFIFGEIDGVIVWYYQAGWDQLLLLCISGSIAFVLNLFNLLMIAYTSPLTSNIAGNLKSLFSISLSVVIFHTTITAWNAVGILVAIGGVLLYNHAVTRTKSKGNEDDQNKEYEPLPTVQADSSRGSS